MQVHKPGNLMPDKDPRKNESSNHSTHPNTWADRLAKTEIQLRAF